MNTEQLIKKAAGELKEKYNLPSNGFLSGSALAFTVLSYLTGKTYDYSDVDVFHVNFKVSQSYVLEKAKEKRNYIDRTKAIKYVAYCWHRDNFIDIEDVSEDGMLNTIVYNTSLSNFTDLMSIFFDINCVSCAYDLAEGKALFTSEFEEFLESKILKVTNYIYKIKTALRMIKKSEDTGLKMEKDALDKIAFYSSKSLYGMPCYYLLPKYFKIFMDNRQELENYFTLTKTVNRMKNLKRSYDKDGFSLNILKSYNPTSQNIYSTEDVDHFYYDVRDNIFLSSLLTNFFLFYKNRQFIENVNFVEVGEYKEELRLISRLHKDIKGDINACYGTDILEVLKCIRMLYQYFDYTYDKMLHFIQHNTINIDYRLSAENMTLVELKVDYTAPPKIEEDLPF